ncbi:hypothetical protein [Nonomuraea salmonea]|uniref:Uncharacterized protein n=1 Tax=Nonomuraea salmonea TaxID=46181 RepID=A0ABV5P2S1_9ACTN
MPQQNSSKTTPADVFRVGQTTYQRVYDAPGGGQTSDKKDENRLGSRMRRPH